MELPASLGHLVELSVTGLFGTRDFSFRLDLKEPTLLTGTNGSGKSTILRIVSALGNGEWGTLGRLPYENVTLLFENNVQLSVHRVSPTRLNVQLSGEPFVVNLEELDAEQLVVHDEIVAKLVPEVNIVGPGMYDLRGRFLDRDDLVRYLGQKGMLALTEEQAPLSEFVQKFHLLFVTDQRLVVSDETLGRYRHRTTRVANRTAAELSAHELGRQMQQALSAYASESQRLDRDFPQRVVRAMASEDEVPIDRIEELLGEVEKERVALQAVGLLPRDLSPEAFKDLPLQDAKVRPVIETFVQDTKKKFAVLADLRERLTLFADFLNQHYENKRVVTQTRKGFEVEIDGEPSRTVAPSRLSSGEQQILVLAYEVLFRSEPETLVLIDEPELSLHVLWQDTFVDDLSKMGNLRNLQFMLATHSPSLIGGRDDLKRSLDSMR
jgi:energy-coupling factor transporter ATP-binding protein EcfA2